MPDTCFNLHCIDPSWQPIIEVALAKLDQGYLNSLASDATWLPGKEQIFNAFSLPLSQTNIILFGESPYPRPQSANGYAFWDAAVTNVWSATGLASAVNRATSLRNFIKMLLVAANMLDKDNTSQAAIAAIDKTSLIATLAELFQNMLAQGFLLLNASLVLRKQAVRHDVRQWQGFMQTLLMQLAQQKPAIKLILFGNMAKIIGQLTASHCFAELRAEHPYNTSFILNQEVLDFFRPFSLLENGRRLTD